MKLNVVLGAAVVAGAITGAGSSWAGDKPAAATAGPANKAQHEHAGKEASKDATKEASKDATKAASKDAKEASKDATKAAHGKPGADGAKTAPEGVDGKGTVGAAPTGVDASALAARSAARDAYKQLLNERKAAREAALASKTGEDRAKAAAEVNAQYEAKLRELRGKLFAATKSSLSAEARTARDERLSKLTDKERTDRIAKRKAHLGALEKAHGKKLQHAWFAAELRSHAWRIARLERLKAIAVASERADVAAKLKELSAKEEKLHASRLEKLSKSVPAAEAGAATPVVAAPGAATPAAATPGAHKAAAATPGAASPAVAAPVAPKAASKPQPASAPGAAPQTTTPSAAKGDKK